MRNLALILLVGCAPIGEYVWVDAYPAEAADAAPCVLAPGDLVDVRVFHEDGLSGKMRVRADGMISVPFLGDVPAAGAAPAGLARQIEARLKDFIRTPIVTVVLDEPRPAQLPVVGEVVRPGMYPLADANVLQAIAAAGGLSQFAARDRIFVLRPGGVAPRSRPVRLRFRFEDLARGEQHAIAFRLRPGDSVVVE